MGWGGVGWGGMFTFIGTSTSRWCYATARSSATSTHTWCYATACSSATSTHTWCYATARSSVRHCPFFCNFHTYVMLRHCLFFCNFHTYVMLRHCPFFFKQLSWFDFGPLEEKKSERLVDGKVKPSSSETPFLHQNRRFALAKPWICANYEDGKISAGKFLYVDVCSATSCGCAGAPAPEVGCKKHRATAPTPSHQGDEEEEMCSRGAIWRLQ